MISHAKEALDTHTFTGSHPVHNIMAGFNIWPNHSPYFLPNAFLLMNVLVATQVKGWAGGHTGTATAAITALRY